jgi:hypothetical protein
MLEITISRDLAAAHPDFMAGCVQRGHRVEVFGDEVPDAVQIGQPHPEKGYYAACSGELGDFCGCPISQAASQAVAEP